MARVHTVKSARKNYPEQGIQKGDTYYWWAFRYGGKRMSKKYPRQSQLTQSEFLTQVYEMEESISDLEMPHETCNVADLNDFIEEMRSIAESYSEEIRSLGDEQSERKENMPEGLQEGPTGQLLESRQEACEEFAVELESIDFDEIERGDGESMKEWYERIENKLDEFQGICYSGD